MNYLNHLAVLTVAVLAANFAVAQQAIKDGMTAEEWAGFHRNPSGMMMDDGSARNYGQFGLPKGGGGPEITTVFQSPIYDQWGHAIYERSFTFKGDVDLAGLPCLRRTVEDKPDAIGNQYAEDVSLNQLVIAGVDEFTNYFSTASNEWNQRMHYRYEIDPDGMGGVNTGDDAVIPIIIDNIAIMPETELEVVGMYIDYSTYTLYVDVYTYRYDAGGQYIGYLALEVENSNGVIFYTDFTPFSTGGSAYLTHDYAIYLGPQQPAGDICVNASIWYSHDGPGYSDFSNEFIDETGWANCEDYSGLITDTGEAPPARPYLVTLGDDGVFRTESGSETIEIFNILGQSVVKGQAGQEFSTGGWATGLYVVRVVSPTGENLEYNQKFVVR